MNKNLKIVNDIAQNVIINVKWSDLRTQSNC